MLSGKQSILWPASPDDPGAHTLLSIADLIEAGGGEGLRTYITGRLLAVAVHEPDSPRYWAASAVQHLYERAGDITEDDVQISAGSLQIVLAYLAYLEAALAERRAA